MTYSVCRHPCEDNRDHRRHRRLFPARISFSSSRNHNYQRIHKLCTINHFHYLIQSSYCFVEYIQTQRCTACHRDLIFGLLGRANIQCHYHLDTNS